MEKERDVRNRLMSLAHEGAFPAPFRECLALRKVVVRAGSLDLLLVGRHGDLGVVELKLSSDGQAGGPVVFQLAAYFWSVAAMRGEDLWNGLNAANQRTIKREFGHRFCKTVFHRASKGGKPKPVSLRNLHGYVAVDPGIRSSTGRFESLKDAIRTMNFYLRAHHRARVHPFKLLIVGTSIEVVEP